MKQITVVKLDHVGNKVFDYSGTVLKQTENELSVEAFFVTSIGEAGPLKIYQGDRFVEYYYTDRWYNIFEVHDGETDVLKGYYCNVGYPAQITDGEVSYRDLALDLVVMPDGQQVVLDEDEFAELDLDARTAWRAPPGFGGIAVVVCSKQWAVGSGQSVVSEQSISSIKESPRRRRFPECISARFPVYIRNPQRNNSKQFKPSRL